MKPATVGCDRNHIQEFPTRCKAIVTGAGAGYFRDLTSGFAERLCFWSGYGEETSRKTRDQ